MRAALELNPQQILYGELSRQAYSPSQKLILFGLDLLQTHRANSWATPRLVRAANAAVEAGSEIQTGMINHLAFALAATESESLEKAYAPQECSNCTRSIEAGELFVRVDAHIDDAQFECLNCCPSSCFEYDVIHAENRARSLALLRKVIDEYDESGQLKRV